MPKRRNESEKEYCDRINAEAKEARKAYIKKQRQERNELINKVGKLFVDKCKLTSFDDYERICESVEFNNVVFAYLDGRIKPQAESVAVCEANAVVPPEADTCSTVSGNVCEGNIVVPTEVGTYGTESMA